MGRRRKQDAATVTRDLAVALIARLEAEHVCLEAQRIHVGAALVALRRFLGDQPSPEATNGAAAERR